MEHAESLVVRIGFFVSRSSCHRETIDPSSTLCYAPQPTILDSRVPSLETPAKVGYNLLIPIFEWTSK
jgi:hypothetical protein